MKRRLRDVKIYHHLYRICRDFEDDKCAYCEYPMQCYDHVPPISLCEHINTEEYKEKIGDFLLVPSCLKCNGLLGDYKTRDYHSRLKHLMTKYQRRMFRFTKWTDEDVEELGATLRSLIEFEKVQRDELEERLSGVYRRFSSNMEFPKSVFKTKQP